MSDKWRGVALALGLVIVTAGPLLAQTNSQPPNQTNQHADSMTLHSSTGASRTQTSRSPSVELAPPQSNWHLSVGISSASEIARAQAVAKLSGGPNVLVQLTRTGGLFTDVRVGVARVRLTVGYKF